MWICHAELASFRYPYTIRTFCGHRFVALSRTLCKTVSTYSLTCMVCMDGGEDDIKICPRVTLRFIPQTNQDLSFSSSCVKRYKELSLVLQAQLQIQCENFKLQREHFPSSIHLAYAIIPFSNLPFHFTLQIFDLFLLSMQL